MNTNIIKKTLWTEACNYLGGTVGTSPTTSTSPSTTGKSLTVPKFKTIRESLMYEAGYLDALKDINS